MGTDKAPTLKSSICHRHHCPTRGTGRHQAPFPWCCIKETTRLSLYGHDTASTGNTGHRMDDRCINQLHMVRLNPCCSQITMTRGPRSTPVEVEPFYLTTASGHLVVVHRNHPTRHSLCGSKTWVLECRPLDRYPQALRVGVAPAEGPGPPREQHSRCDSRPVFSP